MCAVCLWEVWRQTDGGGGFVLNLAHQNQQQQPANHLMCRIQKADPGLWDVRDEITGEAYWWRLDDKTVGRERPGDLNWARTQRGDETYHNMKQADVWQEMKCFTNLLPVGINGITPYTITICCPGGNKMERSAIPDMRRVSDVMQTYRRKLCNLRLLLWPKLWSFSNPSNIFLP